MILNVSILDLMILTLWTIVLVIHSKLEARKKMMLKKMKEMFSGGGEKSMKNNNRPNFMTVLSIDSSQTTASSTALPPTIFETITETNNLH
jgi:hypothetical protein